MHGDVAPREPRDAPSVELELVLSTEIEAPALAAYVMLVPVELDTAVGGFTVQSAGS
jgi:hypothetical protein